MSVSTSWWGTLDDSLRRILRFNLAAMVLVLVSLSLVYAGGFRPTRLLVDIVAMAGACAVALGSIPASRRWGADAAILGLTASATVFSAVATWANPNLSALIAMVMLLPLLVGVPHLSRTHIKFLMAYTIIGGAGMVAVTEWRRTVVEPPPWQINSLSIALTLPTVSILVVYLVWDAFQRLTSQSEQLRESRRRVGEVADAARRSMERDLHDGAQQRLLAMSVTIERARKEVASGNTESATELLTQLATDNQETTRELRELARGIYPPLLAERGLVAALQSAARRAALPVTLHAEDFDRPPMSVENAAYFCILEALTNAIKHSSATEVVITLRATPGLEFFVADDGRGFDPASVSTPNGLLGMEARMEAAQGELHVMTAPGRGTTLHGRFPHDSAL